MERYPALKYLPSIFAPWKAEVLRQRQKDVDMYLGLVDEVRDKMKRGVAVDCFTTYLIYEQKNHGMNDLELAYAAGSPFGAGVETVCLDPFTAAHNAQVNLIEYLPVCRFYSQLFPRLCQIRPRIHPQSTSGAG